MAASKKAVEKEHLDLIVKNITDSAAATNLLIEEKFKGVHTAIESVGKRIEAHDTEIKELRTGQGSLMRRVYIGVGLFTAAETVLAFVAHYWHAK